MKLRAVVALLTVGMAVQAEPRRTADEPSSREVSKVIAELSKGYGIEIVLKKADFPATSRSSQILCAEARGAAIEKYVPLLESEWSLYPPEVIKKVGLRKIVLCEGLSVTKQLRAAAPDLENSNLFLDVVRGHESPEYVRSVIHHEFFHMIDQRDDGALYADAGWMALNQKGFRYGAGGDAVQDDDSVSLLTDKLPGFLTKYSLSAVEEDKAEFFANMIVNAEAVARLTRGDAILLAKQKRLKSSLASFCPEMDATFWKAAESLTRD